MLLLGASDWARKDALSRLLVTCPDDVLAALREALKEEQRVRENLARKSKRERRTS